MQSILIKEYGSPEMMYLGESPLPQLKENEVLVKVHAFAVNRADILQRKGKYPSPPGTSPLMGLEIAGTIIDAHRSSLWKVGDRVLGLLPGGGYAEYAAADEGLLAQIPENFSFEEAAAIPEVFLTAFLALKNLGNLKSSETVLIHAASGGVGTAAIQLAKQIGAKVAITASESKHAICKELGADICLNRGNAWRDEIQSLLGKQPINLIIDFLGASYFSDNIDVLSMDGRLVMLALIGGGEAEKVDLRKIVGKRLKIEGSTLRNRDLDYQRRLCREFFSFAMPLFENKSIHPVIDCIMDWTKIAEAHQRMENNQHVGKIVMKIL